jgi:NCK-associated protein 1
MTIVGVILSFRELLREALNAQLEERIPFLHSTIKDFHDHASLPEQSNLVSLDFIHENVIQLSEN